MIASRGSRIGEARCEVIHALMKIVKCTEKAHFEPFLPEVLQAELQRSSAPLSRKPP